MQPLPFHRSDETQHDPPATELQGEVREYGRFNATPGEHDGDPGRGNDGKTRPRECTRDVLSLRAQDGVCPHGSDASRNARGQEGIARPGLTVCGSASAFRPSAVAGDSTRLVRR